MKIIRYTNFLSFCIILTFCYNTLCNSQDFNFLNIKWTDSPDELIKKIKRSGVGIAYLVKNTEGKPYATNLFCLFPTREYVDENKYKYLESNSFHYTSDEDIKKIGYSPYVKVISMNGVGHSPIDSANFFFSYSSNILLGYSIKLGAKCTEDESEDRSDRVYSGKTKCIGYSSMYEGLVEKYGKPSWFLSRSEKWQEKDQSLYYHCMDPTIFLIYMSDKNIENHISNFKAALKKHENKIVSKQ